MSFADIISLEKGHIWTARDDLSNYKLFDAVPLSWASKNYTISEIRLICIFLCKLFIYYIHKAQVFYPANFGLKNYQELYISFWCPKQKQVLRILLAGHLQFGHLQNIEDLLWQLLIGCLFPIKFILRFKNQ